MGMSDSVKDRILEIIAEQAVLEPSDISLDQSLEDLGIDSSDVATGEGQYFLVSMKLFEASEEAFSFGIA